MHKSLAMLTPNAHAWKTRILGQNSFWHRYQVSQSAARITE